MLPFNRAAFGGRKPFKPSDIGKEFATYAWLEPSLSPLTVWQDHTGGTPVTAVNQVVGRIIDPLGNTAIQATTANKPTLQTGASGNLALRHDTTDGLTFTAATPGFSGALGSELAINGGFASDIVGWTNIGGASAAWEAGAIKITAGGTTGGRYQDIALSGSRSALITANIKRQSGTSSISLGVWSHGSFLTLRQVIATVNITGEYIQYSAVVPSDGTGFRVYLQAINGSGVFFVDDISVREVPSSTSIYYTTSSGVVLTHGLPIYSTYDLPGKPGSGTADVYGWILTPGRPSASLEAGIIKYLSRRAGL